MSDGGAVRRTLDELVAARELPGAAVATIRGGAGGEVAVVRAGSVGDATRFRLSSVTKPIVSALAAGLIEDGVLAPGDPIDRWLPELAAPAGAVRPVLVSHVLDSTCGWGFPGDLSLPGVAELLDALGDPRRPDLLPDPEAWLAALAGVPPLRRPGERWLYETPHDLLGILLARAAGRPLPEVLAERLLAPLGMDRTGFSVPAEHRADVAPAVRFEDGALHAADASDPAVPPRFPSGAGGLVSSLGDLVRFARMLLGDGAVDGARVLEPASVATMTTDRLTPAQRSEGGFFLDGQSWGHGGMVDVDPRAPWQAHGRYGWVGVSGASLHVRRDRGTAVICLTPRELFTAEDTALMQRLWTAAAADLGELSTI